MSSSDLDLFHMIANAGPMVQMVLFLLLFFSVASWAVMILKYRYIRTAFRESASFNNFFWKSRDLSDAYSKSRQLQGSPMARIFRVGYSELRKTSQAGSTRNNSSPGDRQSGTPTNKSSLGATLTGTETIKRSLRRATNTEVTRLMQMVPFLATTGNTAPFIGLFGTVWGIINSFQGIGQMGSASLAVVAPGISEALVATAAGLGAAIPAVIAFNYFMQKIRIIESELQNFSADFLNIVERNIVREGSKN